MATKKKMALVERKPTDIEKVERLVIEVVARKEALNNAEAALVKPEEALRKLLRKLPYHKYVLENGFGYELQQYKKTEIRNETSAKVWALENPDARMAVQIAKVTKAFEGKPMPKWATRVHAEKLMPIKPQLKKPNQHDER